MRRFASETSRISFLLIVVLTLANVAAADQIVLKNGDRLTGTIVKSDGKTLVLKSDLVGEVATCRTHRAAPNKTIYC